MTSTWALDDETIALLRASAAAGVSAVALGRRLHVHPRVVRDWWRRLGVRSGRRTPRPPEAPLTPAYDRCACGRGKKTVARQCRPCWRAARATGAPPATDERTRGAPALPPDRGAPAGRRPDA